MPVVVPDVVASLARDVDALLALDPHELPGESLLSTYERLHEVEARLAAVKADLLRVADAKDATVEQCGRSPRGFLVEELRVAPTEASRQLRLARMLPTVPVVAAALRAGDISAEHASMILSLLGRGVPDELRSVVEAELVKLAREHPPHVLARTIHDILVMLGLDEDADERAARRYSERGVELAETFDGYGSLGGTLSAQLREKLAVALRSAGGDTPAGPEDDRSVRQRHHDALEDIVDHYLGTARLSDDNGERPRIVVTISWEALLDGLSTRMGTLDSGVQISPTDVRRLAGDAQILPVMMSSQGEVLDVGTPTTTFPARIKRAAKVRDGCVCAFPRCRRRIAECHHIVWLSHGGASTLDNAAWLCSFHHWLIHQRGWALRRNPDGSYSWTNPHGHTVTGDPPRRT